MSDSRFFNSQVDQSSHFEYLRSAVACLIQAEDGPKAQRAEMLRAADVHLRIFLEWIVPEASPFIWAIARMGMMEVQRLLGEHGEL